MACCQQGAEIQALNMQEDRWLSLPQTVFFLKGFSKVLLKPQGEESLVVAVLPGVESFAQLCASDLVGQVTMSVNLQNLFLFCNFLSLYQ